jgi:hypothetical protein
VNERQDLLSDLFLDISNRVFWESLDWLTLIFEIGFVFAILKVPVLRFWCALAIVFHFMVMMMLNISFHQQFAGVLHIPDQLGCKCPAV